MLKFLATTKNTRKSNQKTRVIIARKLVEKRECEIASRNLLVAIA